MTRMVDLNDIVGITDIADELNLTLAAVSQWRTRYDTFPKPIKVISNSIPLYSLQQVLNWYYNVHSTKSK